MGIDIHVMRVLLAAQGAQLPFQHTATIGRQTIQMSARQAQLAFGEFGLTSPLDIGRSGDYADHLFRLLGAKEIVSIDFSDFEGADVLHDMNQPVAPSLKERFDVVFDGGSLEHIFNFPVAIRNCMEMVRVGGYFIGCSPANNSCGHGFYQFSPELYFRVFSKENGFRIHQLLLWDKTERAE